ncbi:LOW QUALITY PROTEIN: hypothetical protein Cgig2_025080 [Carnegiea gigantea]|uniref:DUF8040 domain-containing protein n=1 Tax=Carnegiea gigantea TaxID=171969 RepID=A0A9Q1KID9_9CARY|nr:LOW QUALITY PROTEIN: hypothetical protein Cgig2_025080 [Carnegiea gigantea]
MRRKLWSLELPLPFYEVQRPYLGTITIEIPIMKLRFLKSSPFVNRDIDRKNYINSVLYCGDTHCLNQIRIRASPFFELCEMLKRRALLVNTKHISVREQFLMFLHLIGQNVRFRAIGGRFFRLTWTIYSYFHIQQIGYQRSSMSNVYWITLTII